MHETAAPRQQRAREGPDDGPQRGGQGERRRQGKSRQPLINLPLAVPAGLRTLDYCLLEYPAVPGRIPQAFIDELLTRADIVDIIDILIALRRAVRQF